MTSINLLGLILIAVSFGLIAYECQKNKWGYLAVVFAAIGGKMFL
jgi:membrane-bound ClpP family serine protease